MLEWLKTLMERIAHYRAAIENIAFNIVGGVLTALIFYLCTRARNKWQSWRFKRIFGTETGSHFLVYGSLILHPLLIRLIPTELSKLRDYPLTKSTDERFAFSAEKTASASEIRAAAYVAAALGKDGGVASHFVSDEFLRDKLDVDFVSFGALSNLKTLDVFTNDANQLAEYDSQQESFVSKKTRKPLCRPRQDYDYGIILKIHPRQFPRRTWIACAGLAEWGTSGSAWFLSRRWRDIEKLVKGDDHFVAVIEVKKEQDESASLVALYQDPRLCLDIAPF